MEMTIDLSPQAERWINLQAKQRGLRPVEVAKGLIEDRVPAPTPTISAKNAAAIAQLEAWMKEEYTDDPEEIRKADEEWLELQHNLNANRAELGERLVYV